MLQHRVDRALFLIARLPPLAGDCHWPALFSQKGESMPVYHVLAWITQQARQRAAATWDREPKTLKAVCAVNPDGSGTAILWNTRWTHSGDDRTPGRSEAQPATVSLAIPTVAPALQVRSWVIDDRYPAIDVRALTPQQVARMRRGEPLIERDPQPLLDVDRTETRHDGQVAVDGLQMRAESVRFVTWARPDRREK